MNLRIVWMGDEKKHQRRLRKPTYKEEVEALGNHLVQKWERRDEAKAEKWAKNLTPEDIESIYNSLSRNEDSWPSNDKQPVDKPI